MSAESPLLECVVNVSEGRDRATLDALAVVISDTPRVRLLHADVGAGAHRTVFTFTGRPSAVFRAARRVYEVAAERIDMRQHRGEHPRIGAVDVCPFIPVRNVTMEETVARTRVLGEELGASLGIPVYLYEASATQDYRRNLAVLRRGEYEGLAEKVKDPRWQPDYGPALNSRFGATVLGARAFLIAWNINLAAGATLAQAKTIAARLRGSGSQGRPGLFPGLKAIGWYIPEYGRHQVSCNVVDPDATNLYTVLVAARELAEELGTSVTGSELIGMIPEKHLRAVVRATYTNGTVLSRLEELERSVALLGLGDLAEFNWRGRVLEF